MAPSQSSPDSSSAPTAAPTSFPAPVPPPQDHNHTPQPNNASTSSSISPAPQPTISEAITTIRPYDLTGVHLRPCSRESLLTGMGSGFAVGGLRFVLGARQYTAMSWAVGAFCVTSMGAYAFCREKRRLEKQAMDRAKEIMERKQKEKMAEMAREKARRRRAIEEQGRRSEGGGGGGGGWFGFGGKKE